MTDPKTPDFSLALTEARRGLDAQAAQLDSLRQRAGQLISVGGVAAAFVAAMAAALDREIPAWSATTSLVMFALLAVGCGWILARHNMFVSQSPVVLVTWAESPAGQEPGAMDRELALYMAGQYAANRSVLDRLHLVLQLALIALFVEVVVLAVGAV